MHARSPMAMLAVLAARVSLGAVTITDAMDEVDIPCFKIVTASATYYYDKAGAAFTSIVDKDGLDWVGYHKTGGSAGNYRGIPNLGDIFGHPGNTGATSTTPDTKGVAHSTVTVNSTKTGGWSSTWKFYDTHAEMTLNSAGGSFWILYEGTPGGAVAADDHIWLSNGLDFSCYDYHQSSRYRAEIGNTSGVASGSEWAIFADGPKNRSLIYVHDDDAHDDEYWEMQNNMTVFGFARTNLTMHMDNGDTPQRLIVALVESKDPATVKSVIDQLWSGGPVVTAPTVVTNTATNVTSSAARLRGEVTSTGGENPTVKIYWGISDGGTTAGNWGNVADLGTKGTGTFYRDVTGLADDTTYYFRCHASNSAGGSWASSGRQFTTLVATAPFVNVTAPTGGTYKGRQDVTITWASNVAGNVEIEFTQNGGSSWQSVDPSTANSGSYVCQLPNANSTSCRFRVSDLDGDPSGESGSFTVEQITDSDNDRLDDTWETTYFGNLTTTDGGATDTDGDGVSDLAEFWSGSDPTADEGGGDDSGVFSCALGGRTAAASGAAVAGAYWMFLMAVAAIGRQTNRPKRVVKVPRVGRSSCVEETP